MKSSTRWWFERDRERELHLEVLEVYAETGDVSILEELEQVRAFESMRLDTGSRV